MLTKLGYFSRKVLKSYKVLMLLTLAGLLVVSLPRMSISIGGFLITLLAIAFQYFLAIHNKLYRIRVPLEEMGAFSNDIRFTFKQKTYNIPDNKSLAKMLCLTPLLLSMGWVAPLVYMALILLAYGPRLVGLYKVYLGKDNAADTHVQKLNNYKPEVAVYVTGLQNVAYQINQWLPVLHALPFRFVIVIREKKTFYDMRETSIPVYYARSMRELEHFRAAGIKTVLYPANTQKNVQFLRLSDLNHFFINHGESDKVVNQSKFLMAYDKLLVGGPLAKRRLEAANLPLRDDHVEFVGRPQTELLLNQVEGKAKYIKTVLYAPTWEGFVEEANYSSVTEIGFSMLQALVESGDYRVIFKPHPYTGVAKNINKHFLKEMQSYCLSKENAEYAGFDADLYSLMNESDVLISDISSVVNEYLYTLKPIVVTNFKGMESSLFESLFATVKAAYLFDGVSSVNNLLSSIYLDDQKFNVRKLVCEDSLGGTNISALQRFEVVISNSLTKDSGGVAD
ncbi:CDP-glycerol glycerophosphotransferase family protein [Kushneria konosiri]|nr:CDP-glycerol glycerophosphotransferase family protein [Kushneria konosiri]